MTLQVEEKSLELALVKAAGQLSLTQEELEYKILNQSNGFLGFGKKITVEVWAKRGRKPSRAQVPEKERKQLIGNLEKFLCQVSDLMTSEKVQVKVTDEGYRVVFDIQNEEIANQLSKNNKLAESFEHILRKQPRHLKHELPFRVFVDAQRTRLNREDELVTMARNLSDKVHEKKKPIVLNYRSSYDRKIIHMTLDKDQRVHTKSIGNGPNRKLMILPNKETERMSV